MPLMRDHAYRKCGPKWSAVSRRSAVDKQESEICLSCAITRTEKSDPSGQIPLESRSEKKRIGYSPVKANGLI